MFLRCTLFALAAMTLGVIASPRAAADPFLPVPPASFLNYHVSTAHGLSEEVAQDMVVRARLARHFHMTEAGVVAYVQQNLVEGRLSAAQAGRYKIACITPSGREYFITEHLAVGTPVFLLAETGQPILRLACGNPLVSSLPPVAPKPRIKPAALVASRTAVPAPVVTPPALAPVSFNVAPALTATTLSAPTMVKIAGLTQVLSHGSTNFVPVAIGGVALGLLSHHHHAPTPMPTPGPPAAVPEPSTLALLALCGGFLLAGCLRARRRD